MNGPHFGNRRTRKRAYPEDVRMFVKFLEISGPVA
jgi:hypothetical protein